MGLETSMYNLTPPKHLTAHLLRIIVGELRPVRGARDFYPEDARLRSWLFSHFEEVSRIFAFEEYDAPIVESESLYTRKSGEEITDQIYNFEDKGGRRISLRPEMTPSLARLIIQKTPVLSFPLKWYSIPQCWRYERMTRGRKREHYQWNMDIIGVDNTSAEVELLSAIISLFKRLGLSKEDVGIRISNRKLLQELLSSIGTPEDQFSEICIVLDKIHKLSKEDILENLSQLGLSEDASSQIFDMLKIPDLSTFEQKLGSNSEAVLELKELFNLANACNITDWLSFDASIVRGLSYYTGTVFEAFDKKQDFRAICGGGRYDKLLSSFNAKDIPCCGFGFGDVVIMEILQERNLIPSLLQSTEDVVFFMEDSLREVAMKVATILRKNGRSVDLIMESKKVKKALKYANKVGASRLIMITPDEWEKESIRIKDMASGEESELLLSKL